MKLLNLVFAMVFPIILIGCGGGDPSEASDPALDQAKTLQIKTIDLTD